MLCDRRAFSPLRVCVALCLLFCIDTYRQKRICECNNDSDHDYDIMKERKAVYWVTWVRLILMSFYSNKSIFSYSAASSPKVSHRNLNHIYYMYLLIFLPNINRMNQSAIFCNRDNEFFFFYFFKDRGGKVGVVFGLDNWKGNGLNKKNETWNVRIYHRLDI